MNKRITVDQKTFEAFHIFLLKDGYVYSAHNESYTSERHGRKMLRRTRHGVMNAPMTKKFDHFLSLWLREGKSFIENLRKEADIILQ